MSNLIWPIQGSPIPKERPRVNTKTGHVYTPKKTKTWENIIRQQLVSPPNYQGNVEMFLHFHISKKRFKKVDLDNLVKSALDACNGFLYKDDSQVVRIDAIKTIAENNEMLIIGVSEITITEVEP